ncbi:protein spinster homolog 1-like isoform X2 [Mizuhopecten yessoensis]|uniref:protein spinster homolog 1-like isoform X2 n=1 Tax=Mizuhopecten yessoensis TaxID=6573 RepID=UPI000B45E563|nr:protein spinster homolog 1-like isoform X2 [Mizuhopecten yessoensis]
MLKSEDFSDRSPLLDSGDGETAVNEGAGQRRISRGTSYCIIGVLFVVNLINYMDRYTVAGVLDMVQPYYGLNSSQDGLIQTVFVITYMICSPMFGYLGDRYSRKYLMVVGILFWSGITLASSFIDKDHFWVFLMLRALVGVGEASYVTVAPTIIADLFHDSMRTIMLIIFNVAVPCGSGLGYIVGSNVAKLLGGWQWALRVTPGFGVICAILILILPEPTRGSADGGTNLNKTSFLQDLKELFTNKTLVLSSLGFTCVAFVTGTLALWAPIFIHDSMIFQERTVQQSSDSVSLIFGVITVVAGLTGVAIGGETSRRLKTRYPRADPIICAGGMIVGAPLLFFALYVCRYNTTVAWVLIFFGETAVCINWSIVNDILLYVVIPTRRALASAGQIFVCHALGDASSPYIVGLVSDALAKGYSQPATTPIVQFATLQIALYVTPFVSVLGGTFFLAASMFVVEDRNAAERATDVPSCCIRDCVYATGSR